MVYTGSMPLVETLPSERYAALLYAPSLRVARFACGWYGVGHTAWRHPGEMRGTVIGRQGRFRAHPAMTGGDAQRT